MTFDEWWKKMKPAECDELKPYFEEAWGVSATEEREALAQFANIEAMKQHDMDVAQNPKAAVMHSPDVAKWRKMVAMIRMRSNV